MNTLFLTLKSKFGMFYSSFYQNQAVEITKY